MKRKPVTYSNNYRRLLELAEHLRDSYPDTPLANVLDQLVSLGDTWGTENPEAETGRLFVSFWDICLDNLPDGSFSRRPITPAAARRLVVKGRAAGRLHCLSADDLFAPYRKKERERHDELRASLKKQFRIALSVADFSVKTEGDGEDLYFTNPLNAAQVRGCDRLLVVTCGYTVLKRKRATLPGFRVEPSSISFHLIEASQRHDAVPG